MVLGVANFFSNSIFCINELPSISQVVFSIDLKFAPHFGQSLICRSVFSVSKDRKIKENFCEFPMSKKVIIISVMRITCSVFTFI